MQTDRQRDRTMLTNKTHYFIFMYFNNKTLHVSSRLAGHHQGDQLCTTGIVMLKSNGIVSNYLSLYTADPPDDEQQV